MKIFIKIISHCLLASYLSSSRKLPQNTPFKNPWNFILSKISHPMVYLHLCTTLDITIECSHYSHCYYTVRLTSTRQPQSCCMYYSFGTLSYELDNKKIKSPVLLCHIMWSYRIFGCEMLAPSYRLAATCGVCQQRLVLFEVNESVCVNCNFLLLSYKLGTFQ